MIKKIDFSFRSDLKSRIENCILESEKTPRNLICLGCAIKVPLKTIVYPALKQMKKKLSGSNVTIDLGRDAYVFETDKNVVLNRRVYPLDQFKRSQEYEIPDNIKRFKSQSVILLSSYMDPVSSDEIVESLSRFCLAASKSKLPFCIGKGHTIQISKAPRQKFILADYLTFQKGDYYGFANNDTIVTIDINLKHSSWLNIFVSLNNALNDLFVYGVHKEITINPVYDSIYEKDNKLIRNYLQKYADNFRKHNFKIADRGPLELGLEAIGATVIGFSPKEPPGACGLLPDQTLIVTRPIGDLSALVLYIIRQIGGDLSDKIKELKMDVLTSMLTSNLKIAEIIAEYLPSKGVGFDEFRHITATKDISGEGISAFEDLALQSNVDIHIDNIKLHAQTLSGLNVPNNTSNTNGPIIIAVHRKLVKDIIKRLRCIGCQPWIAGKVGKRNKQPTIFLSKKLRKLPFLKNKVSKFLDSYRFI